MISHRGLDLGSPYDVRTTLHMHINVPINVPITCTRSGLDACSRLSLGTCRVHVQVQAELQQELARSGGMVVDLVLIILQVCARVQ